MPPTTRVVNVRTESCEVYIGRRCRRPTPASEAGRGAPCTVFEASPFANPFVLERDTPAERERAIRSYRAYICSRLEAADDEDLAGGATGPALCGLLAAMEGKRLGCWCKPQACHGDVLVEILAAARRIADRELGAGKGLTAGVVRAAAGEVRRMGGMA